MKSRDVKHAFYYFYKPSGFHYTTKDGRTVKGKIPVVTVCIGVADGIFSRGFTICSKSEVSFVKKTGRKEALKKMLVANGKKRTESPVLSNKAIDQVLLCDTFNTSSDFFLYKSTYNVVPTFFEKKCLGLV